MYICIYIIYIYIYVIHQPIYDLVFGILKSTRPKCQVQWPSSQRAQDDFADEVRAICGDASLEFAAPEAPNSPETPATLGWPESWGLPPDHPYILKQ